MKNLFYLLILICLTITASGQTGSAEITEIEKETDCQHILTTVCVFDSNDWYMPDLILSDFSFSENGTPVVPPELELLNSCEGGCADIAILLDLSGSMDNYVDSFYTALSIFAAGLGPIDYRICMSVFNGCPEQIFPDDGVRRLVHTDFAVPPPCSIGTDIWATTEAEFAKLFAAVQMYYSLPWSERGSGWEDQFGALWWAIDTLDWRPGCRKAAVMFTDEEVQVETAPCLPYFDQYDSSLFKMMNYCWEESVTFFAVCPRDSNMYYQLGDPPERGYYAGYRELAESTGGIWSNINDDEYTEMVAALAEAIANIPCCYRFRYLTAQYCAGAEVDLNVRIDKLGEYIAEDDTSYIPFCPPELLPVMPSPCGGVTSCANQQIRVFFDNAYYGDLVPSSVTLTLNGSTIPFADLSRAGDTLIYSPTTSFAHRDTVVFSYDYFENVWGCVGSMPPCSFLVDLEPPTIVDHYPAEGETVFIYSLDIWADITDDFTNVDTASVPGSVYITLGGDTLVTSPPVWTISTDTVNVLVDSLFSWHDGFVTVCVSDLYDSPTYN
ncbi:hypothetical protein DRQ36_10075, partial [bacterium]